MMGEQAKSEALFYYFTLEVHVPQSHLLRLIGRTMDFGFLRGRLRPLYSETGVRRWTPRFCCGCPLIGYLYGITSKSGVCVKRWWRRRNIPVPARPSMCSRTRAANVIAVTRTYPEAVEA